MVDTEGIPDDDVGVGQRTIRMHIHRQAVVVGALIGVVAPSVALRRVVCGDPQVVVAKSAHRC